MANEAGKEGGTAFQKYRFISRYYFRILSGFESVKSQNPFRNQFLEPTGSESTKPPFLVSQQNQRAANGHTYLWGLVGFALAWLVTHLKKDLNDSELFTIYAGLTAAPMVLKRIFVHKTYLRSSTEMDIAKRPIHWGRCAVKWLGLLVTFMVLMLCYMLLPESIKQYYRPAADFLLPLSVVTLILAMPYIVLIDRRMLYPEDGYFQSGLFTLGQWNAIDWARLGRHALEWTIKGYFLPFMFIGTSSHLRLMSEDGFQVSTFSAFYGTTLNLILTLDICFGAIGYMLTLRLLDTHIRSIEPTLLGWIAAIICYAPFSTLVWGNLLHYKGTTDWQDWLHPYPITYITWGFVILLLLGIYTWCTCVFDCRFSNLTNRGIITNGPYKYLKHPAYVCKNVAWWLMSVPFITHTSWSASLWACLCLVITNAIYYIRAWTEERHLNQERRYRAYCRWIRKYGFVSQFLQLLKRPL